MRLSTWHNKQTPEVFCSTMRQTHIYRSSSRGLQRPAGRHKPVFEFEHCRISLAFLWVTYVANMAKSHFPKSLVLLYTCRKVCFDLRQVA